MIHTQTYIHTHARSWRKHVRMMGGYFLSDLFLPLQISRVVPAVNASQGGKDLHLNSSGWMLHEIYFWGGRENKIFLMEFTG